ncbi:unnamed protein product, partial [Amoebophrya sp. A120]
SEGPRHPAAARRGLQPKKALRRRARAPFLLGLVWFGAYRRAAAAAVCCGSPANQEAPPRRALPAPGPARRRAGACWALPPSFASSASPPPAPMQVRGGRALCPPVVLLAWPPRVYVCARMRCVLDARGLTPLPAPERVGLLFAVLPVLAFARCFASAAEFAWLVVSNEPGLESPARRCPQPSRPGLAVPIHREAPCEWKAAPALSCFCASCGKDTQTSRKCARPLR